MKVAAMFVVNMAGLAVGVIVMGVVLMPVLVIVMGLCEHGR